MKNRINSLTSIALFITIQSFSLALGGTNDNPDILKSNSAKKEVISLKDVPILSFSKPDVEALSEEDTNRDKNGYYYRFGVAIPVNISPENSGIWTTNANGDRIWRLRIKSTQAKALSFLFSKFKLYGASKIDVYDKNKKRVHRTYKKQDVLETGVQNMSLCKGDFLMLRLVEPKNTKPSELRIERIFYAYRSYGDIGYQEKINNSQSCEVNINCFNEGKEWQDEKRGVAKILIVEGSSQGYCTGSLVNNTEQDCKPYFLTAMHCGVNSTPSDLNQWRFYFNFEAPGCANPTSIYQVPNQYITGCQKLAGSEDVNGNQIKKSDMFLVQLGSPSNEMETVQKLKSFNAYWNGWDANNTASEEGVGIHHPSGDIKKISSYTSTVTSGSYSGFFPNTHWFVRWASTPNGYGVTEGGSSGSPLFTYNDGNSRIVGTLSGGSSYCNSTSGKDLYGKMSYHWTSNGTTPDMQLKPWLDPGNTGVKVLDGSSNPCGTYGTPDGPCAATSQECDEYIANVKLKTIDNTTGCDNYTLYDTQTTTIGYDTTYTVSVTPGTVNSGSGSYNTGDVIGVWIDWNQDGDFLDIYEKIGSQTLNSNAPVLFDLDVPKGIASGSYTMRVRIDNDPSQTGAIDPCGTTQYGEVEDYKIIHQSNLGLNELAPPFNVSLYPNPTKGWINIKYAGKGENATLNIVDAIGKTIWTKQVQLNDGTIQKVNFTNFDSGIYYINITGKQSRSVLKVIKK